MKKILLVSALSIPLALLILDLLIGSWGSYLIPAIAGSATSYYIFSYTIRNTIFRNNKKKRVWIYIAIILTIFGSISAGIGGADGGPFNEESAGLQLVVGVIYILAFSLYTVIGENSVESTDFGNEHKGKAGKVFIIILSIFVYGLIVFGTVLSIITIQTNSNLFI